jgi:hypothetical protein
MLRSTIRRFERSLSAHPGRTSGPPISRSITPSPPLLTPSGYTCTTADCTPIPMPNLPSPLSHPKYPVPSSPPFPPSRPNPPRSTQRSCAGT